MKFTNHYLLCLILLPVFILAQSQFEKIIGSKRYIKKDGIRYTGSESKNTC